MSLTKGTTYMLVAQFVFMAGGYAIHFGLGRLLGPEQYGIYGVMLSLITLSTILLTSGIPPAISKYVSEGNDPQAVRAAAMEVQIIFAAIITIVYLLLSGYIANTLNDPGLVNLIRLTSIVLIPYAFYSIYQGYLNGLKQFGTQAKLTILYSLSKVVGVFAFVLAGFKVAGAIAGFAMAPFLAGIAAFLSNRKQSKNVFDSRKILAFAAPFAVIALATTAITSIDLLAVKSYTTSAEAGYYNAASTIAKVVLVLAGAMTATLFPAISSSTSKNNSELTREYITKSVRYGLMFAVLAAVLFYSSSAGIIGLIYSSAFLPAAPALRILAFGITAFSLFSILSAVISGSGRPYASMAILLIATLSDIALNVYLVPAFGIAGAAWATTISSFFALLLSAAYVIRKFNALIGAGSIARIGLASGITLAIRITIWSVSAVIFLLVIAAAIAYKYKAGAFRAGSFHL